LTASRRSDVDVIVLDLDGGEMLVECLSGIASQSVLPGRIIVWDNGSKEPVESRPGVQDSVEVFRSEENRGFAGGANAALRLTNAPFVALVNNDVVLDPSWVATLMAALDESPHLGAVQSVILQPDGLVDGAGIDISDGTIRQRGHGAKPDRLSGEAWGVSATAVIYRRQALDEIQLSGGIFDERLFAYYEDVELCARLIDGGWTLRVLPEALATHRGSSTAERLGTEALRLRVRNRWLVHRSHPEVGQSTALMAEDAKEALRSILDGDVSAAVVRLRTAIRALSGR